MDRIGRFTVILATLSLVAFEPWPCRAQPAARPGHINPASPDRSRGQHHRPAARAD